MPKIKFTDTNLKRLSVDKMTWFSDPSARGLQLCVTAGGRKTWYLNKWDVSAQKTRRVKLGQWYPKGTHCRWAKDQIGKAALDFQEGKVRTREELELEAVGIPTLREAFEREMQFRRNRGEAFGGPIHENTDRNYTRDFERYLAKWADDRMDSIDVGASLGARMVYDGKGRNETTDTAKLRHRFELSLLHSSVNMVEAGILKLLRVAAEWTRPGTADDVKLSFHRDFITAQMDPATLTSLTKAWQAGAISHDTLLMNLKKGELLDVNRPIEQEIDLIETDDVDLKLIVGGVE